MSSCNIKPYFNGFARVKVTGQRIDSKENVTVIDIRPDVRFVPICHECKRKATATHQTVHRSVRDLNFGNSVIFLAILYRKLVCAECGCIRTEYFDFVEIYLRVTKRLAQYIHDLCKMMTVKDVAKHLGLDWKTVKDAYICARRHFRSCHGYVGPIHRLCKEMVSECQDCF